MMYLFSLLRRKPVQVFNNQCLILWELPAHKSCTSFCEVYQIRPSILGMDLAHDEANLFQAIEGPHHIAYGYM